MNLAFPRPRYHVSAASNWLSDPNGLVWAHGYWHLYYQHNPDGEDWGNMSWGHARSDDLVTWEEMPPALLACREHFIFSGCAVIDPHGAAGFGENALIALYTAARVDGSRQSQYLAVSDDGGSSFVAPDINPVLDLALTDFRDPNIFWHSPSGQWVMVVALSTEHRAALFGSGDLRAWRHLSDIGPWGAPGEVWECPVLIELPIEGTTERRWLFKVDVLTGGPGSGALALSGVFDGTCFHYDRHLDKADWQPVDHGSDFYAAVPWHEPRDALGRPCWIGWTGNHSYQGKLPPTGWRGAMSSPRRLSFRRADRHYKLIQQVETALSAEFVDKQEIAVNQTTLDLALASRLSFTLDPTDRILISLTAADGQSIRLDLAEGRASIDRTAGFHSGYDQAVTAFVAPGLVTIWLDSAIIEIESALGRDWMSVQHRLFGDRVTLDLKSERLLSIELARFSLPDRSALDGHIERQR